MGDIVADNLLGLSAAQDRIKTTQLNIAKNKVQNAHRVDSVTNYNGKTGGINVTLNRATDPFLENLFNKSITATNHTGVIKDSLLFLQNGITDPQNKTKSNLVSQVETFINTAKQLVTTPTTSLKQNFINKGENLAKAISDTTYKILDLRMEADSNISDALISVNGYISQLFHLNIAMGGNSSSSELLDQRDNLISKIAEFLEIKVSFGVNNNALISTANGSLNLIDSSLYATFNYSGVSNKESFLLEDPGINSITMDVLNVEGHPIGNVKVVEGFDSSITKIDGGKIGGFLKLRDDILPKANEAIASLSSQVMNTVNAIHNRYSPFPPKTKHISSLEVFSSDPINWQGKLTITALTNNGMSLEGNNNSGAVRPITIDLNTLPTRSPNGAATISELINEINSYLSRGPADNRLALGAIAEVNFNPPPAPTYLLNNIKLAGMSDVNAAGIFSFDLELDGSKYFGSKVEVLSVTSPTGYAPNLPQIFELGKGQHTRTNQQITVGGIIGGPQNIDVRIRVIGDNGVIEEGTARFFINPALAGGTQMINKRVTGTALGGGSMVNVGSDTYAPIAVAKLVDENDIEIDPNSGLAGKLVIEARNNNNGLLISSDQDDTFNGFSNFFGMHNFFTKGDITGTFTVDAAIKANPNLLSAGTMKTGNNLYTVAQGSGVAASASMLFSVNPVGNNSTVTINGVTFTFVNVLTGNPNEIIRNIALATNLANLKNAINNHPELSSIIMAEHDLNIADTLTINSKELGTSSNALTLGVNLQGGGTVNITPMGGAATGANANHANIHLSGGTDTNVQVAKFSQAIGSDAIDFFKEIEQLQSKTWDFRANSFVPANTNTIFGYAKFITELLSNQLNAAKADFQVAQTVKEDLSSKLQDTIGIDKDKEIVKLSEFAQSLSAIIAIAHLASSIYREAINTLKVN